MRDPDGRERVEALLVQFERQDAAQEGARRKPSYDFNRIRERLGLPRRERPKARLASAPSDEVH